MTGRASRWPIWHTQPAGFAVSGYWPVLTGSLVVLIVPQLLGMLIGVLSGAPSDPATEAGRLLDNIALIFMFSRVFTWAASLVAVPLSGLAARRRLAGRGIATWIQD